MSSTARKEANWCRIVELSNSMDPTQKAGNQLKEVKVAAGNRNADELVLVGYYTSAPAGITAELLGLRQGRISQVFVLLEEVPPVRDL